MSSTTLQEVATGHETVRQQISVAKTILLQAVDLLDNYLSSDEQLTVHSQYLPGSTIGKHLRHARDHYVLLAEGLLNPSPRVVSYDTRIRNTPMETSRSGARTSILETVQQIEELFPDVDPDEQITLEAITPHKHTFQTTVGRELWFASLHCVHHWSMIRVIAGEMGVKLTDDFGFAPSTLVHQGRESTLGKTKL